ncbi:MAG: serine hydrolase, partial [Burkholderiaceae bacterium]
GLLLAQAVERGDLSLDDTVGKLLQGKITLVSPRVANITLRQLITHSACLPRQFGVLRGAQAVETQLRTANRLDLMLGLAQQQIDSQPPCLARYSNFGIAVVGELLSERYGKPWDVLVADQITRPLGMVDTVLERQGQIDRLVPAYSGEASAEPWPMVAFAGVGGLLSTAADLVTFGRALLAGRNGPLGAAAERMLTPLGIYEGREIGYAIFIHGPAQRRTYSHDGLTGGFRAVLLMAPDSGEVTAALVSNRQAPLGQMAQAWWAQRYPVEHQPVAMDPATLPAVAGSYATTSELQLWIVVQGQTVYARSRGNVFRAYVPVATDRFTRPAGGARIVFQRDAAGAVAGLTLEQSGNRFVMHKAGPLPPTEILPDGRAQDYVGRYRVTPPTGPAVVFDVREEEGQLLVRSSRFPWEPVLPLAGQADRFHYDTAAAQLQFERDADGRVVALVLHQRGALRAGRVAAGS